MNDTMTYQRNGEPTDFATWYNTCATPTDQHDAKERLVKSLMAQGAAWQDAGTTVDTILHYDIPSNQRGNTGGRESLPTDATSMEEDLATATNRFATVDERGAAEVRVVDALITLGLKPTAAKSFVISQSTSRNGGVPLPRSIDATPINLNDYRKGVVRNEVSP